jgi:hypothetical protein
MTKRTRILVAVLCFLVLAAIGSMFVPVTSRMENRSSGQNDDR